MDEKFTDNFAALKVVKEVLFSNSSEFKDDLESYKKWRQKERARRNSDEWTQSREI